MTEPVVGGKGSARISDPILRVDDERVLVPPDRERHRHGPHDTIADWRRAAASTSRIERASSSRSYSRPHRAVLPVNRPVRVEVVVGELVAQIILAIPL